MEVETGDYFTVLFKILWQGMVNFLVFNLLTSKHAKDLCAT